MAVYSRPGYVSLNGRVLLQADNIDGKTSRSNTSVTTLQLDYAGHSVGPLEVEFTVSSAVPASGIEGAVVQKLIAAGEVPLAFTFAGSTYNCIGRIDETSFKTAVGEKNVSSFTYKGGLLNIASAA